MTIRSASSTGRSKLEDNLAALEVEITEEDHAQIDELVPPGETVL